MSTTTRVLDANVNGTVYTANVNSALEAIDTCHSGTTPPTDEVANGKLWLDTSTTPAILKVYNNAAWEAIVVSASSPEFSGLTVDGTIENTGATDINMDGAASGQLKLGGAGYKAAIALNADGMNVYTNSLSRGVILGTNETQRLRVAGSGDVSFYDNTGSTPQFFWDASAERLGIGTTSPTAALDVEGAIKATDLTLSSGALNGVTSSNTFKRVVQAGVVSDYTSYSTTTTTAYWAQGPVVQITPQSPGNTKLIGVFSVDLRSSVSASTTDAGTNLIVKYYNGSAYVNTGATRTPLIASNLVGNASLDDEISIPFELTNAQRRSDTGNWTLRLHFSCVYADNQSIISSGNVIFWEVDA